MLTMESLSHGAVAVGEVGAVGGGVGGVTAIVENEIKHRR